MRAGLFLLLFCAGCGVSSGPRPVVPGEKVRIPPPIEGAPAYCADSDAVDVWAFDCGERCVPRLEYKILCHTGGPPHLFLSDPKAIPSSEWARVPDEPIYDCTDAAAWRIFATKFEAHHWGELDDNYVISWVGETVSDCARRPPPSATRDYFEKHWDRPYFTADEITPE